MPADFDAFGEAIAKSLHMMDDRTWREVAQETATNWPGSEAPIRQSLDLGTFSKVFLAKMPSGAK
jgi:hypothetical protein